MYIAMDLLFHFLSSGGRLLLPASKSFRNRFLHDSRVLMNGIQYAVTAAPSLFFRLHLFCFFPVQVFDISTDPVRYTNSFDVQLHIFLLLQSPVQVHAPEESCSIKEAQVQKVRKNKEFKGQLVSHQWRALN